MFANKKLRRWTIGIAGVTAIVAGSWALVDYLKDRRTERIYNAELEKVVALGDLAREEEFHAKLDRMRDFINDHSDHRMGKEFWRLHAQADGIGYLQRIRAHAEGESDEPAPMDCSTRSNLMSKMLQDQGYETRIVALFDTDKTTRSHTVVDILNPETGRWETQDPDYDLFWKSTKTGERISIADESGDLDAILPCGPTHCGWDNVGRDGQKATTVKLMLDIIGITRKGKDVRYAVYSPRANLDATFEQGGEKGRFCEVHEKRCRDGFVAIGGHAALEQKLYR
ncbi:hypothetical protein [Methyloligella solikamskensis]|uniref:Transglutaminase-like domain-containing protein n=1 Tax=Methyloligella solikamskensis TaxID=1177756 RepID=A0ABW3JCZ8_9HYPH